MAIGTAAGSAARDTARLKTRASDCCAWLWAEANEMNAMAERVLISHRRDFCCRRAAARWGAAGGAGEPNWTPLAAARARGAGVGGPAGGPRRRPRRGTQTLCATFEMRGRRGGSRRRRGARRGLFREGDWSGRRSTAANEREEELTGSPHEISTSRPRRRRRVSTWNIHVAPAAAPRLSARPTERLGTAQVGLGRSDARYRRALEGNRQSGYSF